MPEHAPPRLIIIGAGGHAKVVAEILRTAPEGYSLIGLTDRDPSPRMIAGLPVLGGDEILERLRADGVELCFVALGDNGLRLRMSKALEALGYEFPRAASVRAMISSSAALGPGVVVMPGAIVNAEATIGGFAIINSGAVVEHDCKVGVAAHLGPNSAIAGGVTIGDGAFIGIGANVLPGVTIGAGAMVGAGACVIADLAAGEVAVGVPARVVQRLG